jgi:hypothetical protein
MIGVVSERRTQPFDGGIQAVLEVHERAIRPEAMPQFVARDDFARMFEHESKNLERLILQTHTSRPLTQLTRSTVQLE